MEFDGSNACVCKSGYTAAGVETMTGIKCILTTRYTVLQPYLEYKVTFNDVAGSSGSTSIATVNPSLTFSDLLMPAAVQCFNWEDGEWLLACVRFLAMAYKLGLILVGGWGRGRDVEQRVPDTEQPVCPAALPARCQGV